MPSFARATSLRKEIFIKIKLNRIIGLIMAYKSNLADYVNVSNISSSFNNAARDFGNKLHNGLGNTITKTLDKKLIKGILLITRAVVTLVYTSLLGMGGTKVIRKEFNRGYELYSQDLGIKFRHYENFADTFHDMNINQVYIDFNHNGTVEICMTPNGNIYRNKSPKTETFHILDNRIKEVKEVLGVK